MVLSVRRPARQLRRLGRRAALPVLGDVRWELRW